MDRMLCRLHVGAPAKAGPACAGTSAAAHTLMLPDGSTMSILPPNSSLPKEPWAWTSRDSACAACWE